MEQRIWVSCEEERAILLEIIMVLSLELEAQGTYDGVTDPLSIELLACRDAIIMAQDMGVQHVVMETDCQEIQRLWDAPQRSTCYHLILEMKEMATGFQGFRLRFSGRQTNMAAHRVARHSLNLSVFMHLYDTILEWLTDCLQSDMLAPNE